MLDMINDAMPVSTALSRGSVIECYSLLSSRTLGLRKGNRSQANSDLANMNMPDAVGNYMPKAIPIRYSS